MSQRSTKPYLLRALYEWCVDSGLTPHLLVSVGPRCKVPRDYVRDDQIVFNISPVACGNLMMGDDWITFSARFNGVAQQIEVPVGGVLGLFARENQEGMMFPPEDDEEGSDGPDAPDGGAPAGGPAPRGRPSLKVVK